MRGKRSKQYRKLMQAYALTFDFRVPYQVLLDAEFIKDAARFKMRLGSMLENTLHGEIKPMITQCCIRHLYDAEVEDSQKIEKEKWIEVAKQAERRRCGHHELETPLSALECIRSVVDAKGSGTNKHRYVVASQEREVREAMRRIAGVPLIYIHRSVMILEPLASKTEDVRYAGEVSKRKSGLLGRRELVAGEKRKRDDGENEEQQVVKKKKRSQGPKQPNPLSMKKSKKAAKPDQENGPRAVARHPSASKSKADATTEASDSVVDPEQAPVKKKRIRKPKTAQQDGPEIVKASAGGDDTD